MELTYTNFNAPLFFAWQITGECNLGCLHCCEESGFTVPGELKGEKVMDICRQIVEAKIPYVALSGGEPMLHPNFYEMCEYLRANNTNVKIETNGIYIEEEDAKRIAKLGLRSVQISIDGATEETHLKLREGGDWHKAIQACKLLVKEGINTEIVYVPTRYSIQETADLIDLAYSLGVYGIYTGKIMRIGRAAENWNELCPTSEQYEKFFTVLQKKADEYMGKMKVYYYPYDVIEEIKYRLEYPAASILVVPNGLVKLIGPLPFVCGDFRKQNLNQVWENYKKAWNEPQVREFAQKVINDHTLLSEANKWVELYKY